jgi:hypothetical protein
MQKGRVLRKQSMSCTNKAQAAQIERELRKQSAC